MQRADRAKRSAVSGRSPHKGAKSLINLSRRCFQPWEVFRECIETLAIMAQGLCHCSVVNSRNGNPPGMQCAISHRLVFLRVPTTLHWVFIGWMSGTV